MKHILADIKRFLLTIVLWKIIVVLAALAVTPLIPLHYPMTAFRDLSFIDFGTNLPYWVKIWGNFDGFYYLLISKDGYQPGIVPFFPLYPLLIRATHFMFPVYRIIIGQSLSLVCFVGAIVTVYRLFRLDMGGRHIRRFSLFFLLILAFPTAFFYSAIYNDSLFFLLATASIYAARTRRWNLASLFGAGATLARLNGLVLLPYLAIEYLTATQPIPDTWNRQKLVAAIRRFLTHPKTWKPIAPILLIPLTFLGFLTYIQIQFTNWRLLFQAMSTWGQDRFILPPQVLWRYFKILFLTFQPHTLTWWVALLETVSLIFYLALLLYSWKKIRVSYWIFFAVSILIPWCTGTLAGMPRYGLHIYPMYLALFLWFGTQRTAVRWISVAFMIALQIAILTLFTRGVFVS